MIQTYLIKTICKKDKSSLHMRTANAQMSLRICGLVCGRTCAFVHSRQSLWCSNCFSCLLDALCSLALHRGAIDWSAVCNCVVFPDHTRVHRISHMQTAKAQTNLRTLVRAFGVRIALAIFLMPCVLWLILEVPWIGLLFVIVWYFLIILT